MKTPSVYFYIIYVSIYYFMANIIGTDVRKNTENNSRLKDVLPM